MMIEVLELRLVAAEEKPKNDILPEHRGRASSEFDSFRAYWTHVCM